MRSDASLDEGRISAADTLRARSDLLAPARDDHIEDGKQLPDQRPGDD